MRKYVIIGLLMPAVVVAVPLEITVKSAAAGAMPIACIMQEPAPTWLVSFVSDLIAPLLGATKQMDVLVSKATLPRTKSDMAHYAERGCALALFFSAGASEHDLEWRLYDTLTVAQLKGKRCVRDGSLAEWALHIVDSVWPEITSQRGSFASLIVACKQAPHNKKRIKNELFLFHPFLSFKQYAPIKMATGHNLAPRWHPQKPLIYFSQHTPFNVRLLSVDQHGSCRVVMNVEGQNMTPTVSPTGRVVLAFSDHGHTRLYEYCFDKTRCKGELTCLTYGNGDYLSPSFIDDNRVVFCQLNDNSVPRLGILTLDGKTIEWLSLGSALCPSVNRRGDRIAFCKKVDGFYQVFSYTIANKSVEQLTKDATHKDEVSWSPCGNYVVCGAQTAKISRIAIVDVQTKALRYITPANERWSDPCWSPYLLLPFVFGKNR